VLGGIEELADPTGGSMDAVKGAVIGPYWESRVKPVGVKTAIERCGHSGSGPVALWTVIGILTAGLLSFGQVGAFSEGFHLLAAQLVKAGKRPYIDFFYQHSPLFLYVYAGWMRLFGESWRSVNVLSAALSAAAIALVAEFVYGRVRDPRWRQASGITAALLMGLNFLVIQWGTMVHPFPLCLLFSVAGFRLVIASVHQNGGAQPMAAGLCAGAAAAVSLLAAPVVPISMLWMAWYNETGKRLKKAAQFLGGAAVPFLPLLWLAVQAPRRVFFDVVGYHLFHRSAGDTRLNIFWHDLRVLIAWLGSTQTLVLVLLAAVGLLFLTDRREWDAGRRAEFSLSFWLIVGLGIFLTTPHPTFLQYFVLLGPFLSILASVGVCAIGSRVGTLRQPAWFVVPVVGLFAMGLVTSAYQERRYLHSYWGQIEALAQEVDRVTPSDGLIFAQEAVYFVARRVPPPGLENSYAGDLQLPPVLAASLHVVPQQEIDEWLASGRLATVLIAADDPRVELLGLRRLYRQEKMFEGNYLFWGQTSRSE